MVFYLRISIVLLTQGRHYNDYVMRPDKAGNSPMSHTILHIIGAYVISLLTREQT